MDVQITRDNKIICWKQLFHESELFMARCFNFSINIETGIIEIDPKFTSIEAIKSFLEFTFRNFSESPLESSRKQAFYMQLDVIKNDYTQFAIAKMKNHLPYYEGFFPNYEHQPETIALAFYKQFNFLALDRRLGKTLIAASLSRVHQLRRTVIISPATAKWNVWFRDLTKKFGYNELFFTILDSTQSRTVKAFNERFVVINYDILARFEKEICSANVDHFILDECHRIKNHTSQRFKNTKKIIDNFPNAKITMLSGTPIRNRVNDVFAYLKLINHELGKSHKIFLDEFTTSQSGRGGSRVTGGRNLDRLKTLLSNFIIRKRRDECINLPKQTFTSYVFELDDYRDDYNKIIKELAEQKEISALSGNLHSLNIVTSKAKMKGIIELAEEIIENDGKVVIFSNYTEPIQILADHFKERCTFVTGKVNPYERDKRAERFRTDPTCEVFLGNTEAAGEAINLAIANEVIIVDFPMTPGPLQQAIDRCIEIGKADNVNVNYTFCRDSVDEYLYSMIVDKDGDINAVIDGGQDSLVNQNITELLIKKLLNRDTKNVDEPVSKNEVFSKEDFRADTLKIDPETPILKKPAFEEPDFL